jgi:hypothetical protein
MRARKKSGSANSRALSILTAAIADADTDIPTMRKHIQAWLGAAPGTFASATSDACCAECKPVAPAQGRIQPQRPF